MNFGKHNSEDESGTRVLLPWQHREGAVEVNLRGFDRPRVVNFVLFPVKTRRVSTSGPVQVVQRLALRWSLSNSDLAILLGFGTPEVAGDFMLGFVPLRGRDIEDRAVNLFRIFEAIQGMLRDEAAEQRWIRQPNESFGGESCLAVMLKGGIEDLVNVRRVVEHIAGR